MIRWRRPCDETEEETRTRFTILIIMAVCDLIFKPHRNVLEFALVSLDPLALTVFVIADQLRLQCLSIGLAHKMTRNVIPATGCSAVLLGGSSTLGREGEDVARPPHDELIVSCREGANTRNHGCMAIPRCELPTPGWRGRRL